MFVSVFFFQKSPAHIPNKEEKLPSLSQCSFWNPKSLSREAQRYDGEVKLPTDADTAELTFSFLFPLEQARKKARRNKKNIYWVYKCSLSPCNGNPLYHSHWREERKPCRAVLSHSIAVLVSTVLRRNLHTKGVQRGTGWVPGASEVVQMDWKSLLPPSQHRFCSLLCPRLSVLCPANTHTWLALTLPRSLSSSWVLFTAWSFWAQSMAAPVKEVLTRKTKLVYPV